MHSNCLLLVHSNISDGQIFFFKSLYYHLGILNVLEWFTGYGIDVGFGSSNIDSGKSGEENVIDKFVEKKVPGYGSNTSEKENSEQSSYKVFENWAKKGDFPNQPEPHQCDRVCKEGERMERTLCSIIYVERAQIWCLVLKGIKTWVCVCVCDRG